MTDQEITELMAYPRVRQTILRLARQEATRIVLKHAKPASAPPDSITYVQAAQLLGMKESTIRTYVCRGQLKGGNGYVTVSSCARFKRKK